MLKIQAITKNSERCKDIGYQSSKTIKNVNYGTVLIKAILTATIKVTNGLSVK